MEKCHKYDTTAYTAALRRLLRCQQYLVARFKIGHTPRKFPTTRVATSRIYAYLARFSRACAVTLDYNTTTRYRLQAFFLRVAPAGYARRQSGQTFCAACPLGTHKNVGDPLRGVPLIRSPPCAVHTKKRLTHRLNGRATIACPLGT